MSAPAKDSRLYVRLSSEQDALIKRAAVEVGETVTEFTVDAAVNHAQDVLADRRLFSLSGPAWREFVALLDRPVQDMPRLRKLFTAESMLDDRR